MLDPRAARLIALLTIDILDAFLRDRCHVAPAAISTASVLYNVPVENVVVVGPEMAGGALVALEASRSYGYVNVNWETLRRDALPFAADIPDRAVRLLNANASAAGAGFALGFALGWRVG